VDGRDHLCIQTCTDRPIRRQLKMNRRRDEPRRSWETTSPVRCPDHGLAARLRELLMVYLCASVARHEAKARSRPFARCCYGSSGRGGSGVASSALFVAVNRLFPGSAPWGGPGLSARPPRRY
jgi:hypothetical protein